MEADIRWLDDPKVFGLVSCQPTVIIRSIRIRKKRQGRSSLGTVSGRKLGVCLFCECASRPVDFYRENADSAQFDTIHVPDILNWQVTTKFIISIPCIPGRGKFTAARLTRWEKDWQKVLSARQSIIL